MVQVFLVKFISDQDKVYYFAGLALSKVVYDKGFLEGPHPLDDFINYLIDADVFKQEVMDLTIIRVPDVGLVNLFVLQHFGLNSLTELPALNLQIEPERDVDLLKG